MKSLIKPLSLGIGFLLLLLLLAIILPFLIDINPYRPQIEKAIRSQTGMDIHINGDIQLSLFPWIGLELNELSIQDAAKFGPEPLLHTGKIRVNARLLPLFNKKIETEMIVLDEVKVKLVTLKDGSSNWIPAAPGKAASTTKEQSDIASRKDTSDRQPETVKTSQILPATLMLGGLQIRQASLLWQDDLNQMKVEINPFNLNISAFEPGKPTSLKSDATIQSSPDGTKADILLQSQLDFNEALNKVGFSSMKFDVNANSAQLPAPLLLSVGGNGQVDLQQDSAQVDLSIRSGEINSALATTISSLSTLPHIKGKFITQPFNLRKQLEQYGISVDTSDPKVMQSAALSLKFAGDQKTIHLKDLRLALDQTEITGTADLSFAPSGYRFNLNGDSIDLDRYLLKSDNPETAAAAAATPAVAALLPAETLKSLNIQGNLHFNAFKVSDMTLNNLSVPVHASKGLITIAPVTAGLFDGKISTETRIDVRGRTPVLSITQKAKGIQAAPASRVFLGKTLVSGTANLEAKLKANGNDPQTLQNTAQGDVHFRFTDGAIHGINIMETLRTARAKLKGQPVAKSTAPMKTDFTEMQGDIHLSNQIISNENLDLKSPFLRLRGHGNVNLKNENINYLADVKITATPTGQGGKDLQDLVGVTIPLRIGGTFDKPSYYPDLKRLVRKQVKKKATKKIRKEIQKELQKKLGIDLKGLF
ncbi:MAG: AsmA family protein [Gammaproteobacteria bacterium]|nr:MAG: AsmA family protein [Gammaproteobacteria bacterium]